MSNDYYVETIKGKFLKILRPEDTVCIKREGGGGVSTLSLLFYT